MGLDEEKPRQISQRCKMYQTSIGDLGAEECLDQVVGCVLHDGRIRGDARALLIRLAEMVELPDYDVALAARKQAYRKRVA